MNDQVPERGPVGRNGVSTVGLVGCGRMGEPIGRHLLAASWPLTVTDVDLERRKRLTAMGASAADSAAEVAARSELTLVVVVDDQQVRAAVAGPDGVFSQAREGSLVAICSSVRPDTCRRLASEGSERRIDVVDVALARGERGAEAGTLLLLCGGDEAVIDRCRPAFAAFAADVARVGDVGAGQVAKIVNNILLWAALRADVEALRLGRALGVEPRVLRQVLALGSAWNRPLGEWGEHRLRWPGKDLEVATQVADELGLELPLVRSLAPLMAELSVEDLHDLA